MTSKDNAGRLFISLCKFGFLFYLCCFVGHTARADIAARSLFVSSAYVGYEVGLNKMADAGQE